MLELGLQGRRHAAHGFAPQAIAHAPQRQQGRRHEQHQGQLQGQSQGQVAKGGNAAAGAAAGAIADLECALLATNTLMGGAADRARLAGEVLRFALELCE